MNIKDTSLNTFGNLRGAYRNSVLLLLLLRKEQKKIPELRTGMKFITGRGSEVSIIKALGRLGREGIVLKYKKEIIPRRVLKAKKLQRYTIFKKAAKIFERESQLESNHWEGRYHSFYHMNPKLPINFISKLKHETAVFFGFRSWFDVVRPEPEDTLLNVRNAWNHFHDNPPKGASKVPQSLGTFIEDKTVLPSNGYEVASGKVRTSEGVMKQAVSNPQLLKLDRRTRGILERYGAMSQNTMKGTQKDSLLSGGCGLDSRKGPGSKASKFS